MKKSDSIGSLKAKGVSITKDKVRDDLQLPISKSQDEEEENDIMREAALAIAQTDAMLKAKRDAMIADL